MVAVDPVMKSFLPQRPRLVNKIRLAIEAKTALMGMRQPVFSCEFFW
jgi:hypothetical protein